MGSAAALALGMWVVAASGPEARYLVGFEDFARGRAEVGAAGGKVVLELGPQRAVAAMLDDAALAALERNPWVRYIEADPPRFPLAQSTPYGIDLVQAPLVWADTTGANRKVCVIDSGLYTDHEDLQNTSVSGYPSGWNTDGCGHGTHVTGTLAALNNTTGVVGVLPNGVSLYVVKVFGGDCSWAYASTLVDALNRCRNAGANVVSMSLGGGFRSVTEQSAFNSAYTAGVLSIAAAGNDGTSGNSYPASYSSVVSVAALDSNKQVASFSQHNSQVELAAPGVGVLSSVPWVDQNTVTVGGVTYAGNYLEGAARTSGVSGNLVSGGLCGSAGSWSGQVVLCERGSISFAQKVANVAAGGGVAALVYNNVAGNFVGTLNGTAQIPALSLSQEDGQSLLGALGQSATVVSLYSSPGSGYEAWSGTSMATPHVSGVAALVWSYDPTWTNAQLRDALQATAEDLGQSGRDPYYGYGLVQAKAALDYLKGGTTPPPTGIQLEVLPIRTKGSKSVDLTWSGATGANVDLYRDGSKLVTTQNDGAYTDVLGKVRGNPVYRVCEEGSTTVCSNEATATF